MDRIAPYIDHGPSGTDFVAPHPGGQSVLAFRAGAPCVTRTLAVAADGSWSAEIHWPDVMAEQLTYPPSHGTWRHEDGKWVAHNPADPAQAAMLVQTVPDPPEVAQRRAEAKAAALEARIAALEAAVAVK